MPQSRIFAHSPLTLTIGYFRAQHIHRAIVASVLLALCLLTGGHAHAQIAVNPVTNKIYMPTAQGLMVIDGITGGTSTINDNGSTSGIKDLTLNPVTNQIYLNVGAGIVQIDGPTGAISVLNTDNQFIFNHFAVDQTTNTIYGFDDVLLATFTGGTSTQAATIKTFDIGIPHDAYIPTGIAFNPITKKLYVSAGNGDLKVVDPATGTLIQSFLVCDDSAAGGVVVNPTANRIYVTCENPGSVFGINGDSDSIVSTIFLSGDGVGALAANPVTNKVYVGDPNNNAVLAIDSGSTTNMTTSIPVGGSPGTIAVDTMRNRIYVAQGDSSITTIDGATNATTTAPIFLSPNSIAANPTTGNVYMSDLSSPFFAALGSATLQTTTNAVPASFFHGTQIAVNPVTNQIYTTSNDSDVTVIDGASGTATQLGANLNDALPLVVNQVTNKVYGFDQTTNDLTVIAGATSTQPASVSGSIPLTIAPGTFPGGLAVNPATNRIYVGASDGSVRVVDAAARSVLLKIGSCAFPQTLQVNPATNKIYALCNNPGAVSIIDGNSNKVIDTISVDAQALIVNLENNHFFLSTPTRLLEFDDTNATAGSIVMDHPGGGVLNPVNHELYLSTPSGVIAMNAGGSNLTQSVTLPVAATVGSNPVLAVDPVTDHIYFSSADDQGIIFVVDGITNLVSTFLESSTPVAIAVNPATNKIYVPNLVDASGTSTLTIFNEQQVQPIPLPLSVVFQGQPNVNSTVSRDPQFQFTATSNFQPFSPPIQNVFFQLDTWQGQWQLATPSGPDFTAQLSSVPLGNHILYAYSTDGQTATLWPNNNLISPIIAFPFTVIEVGTSIGGITIRPQQAVLGTPVTFTTTVTSNVAGEPAPTGTVTFSDGTKVIGTAQLTANGQASFTTSALSLGTHSITANYSGDGTFIGSSSATASPETIVGCTPNRTVAPLPNTQSGNFNSTNEVCFVVQSTKPLFFNCSQMMQRTVTVNGNLFQSSACDSSRGKSVALPASTNGKYFFDVSAGSPSWSSIAFWNQ